MSLYCGKFGGVQRSLSPNGKITVLGGVSDGSEISIIDFTPEEARQILELLESPDVIQLPGSAGVGINAPGSLKLRPFTVAVWTMTDGDTWRVTGHTKILFIGWEDGGIASVVETSWKGYSGMLAAARRFLNDIIISKPFWSAGEAAKELGYSIQRITQIAATGEIRGGFKNKSGWQIPAGWVAEMKGRGKQKPGPKK